MLTIWIDIWEGVFIMNNYSSTETNIIDRKEIIIRWVDYLVEDIRLDYIRFNIWDAEELIRWQEFIEKSEYYLCNGIK